MCVLLSPFFMLRQNGQVTSLEKQNALHKSLQLHGQPSILSLQVGREQTTKQEEEHLAFIHQGAKNTT